MISLIQIAILNILADNQDLCLGVVALTGLFVTVFIISTLEKSSIHLEHK